MCKTALGDNADQQIHRHFQGCLNTRPAPASFEIDSALACYRPVENREVPQLVTQGTSAALRHVTQASVMMIDVVQPAEHLKKKLHEKEPSVPSMVAGIPVHSSPQRKQRRQRSSKSWSL